MFNLLLVPFATRNYQKINNANEQKHSPLRVKNDVTHAIHSLICTNKWAKSRFEVIVTSYVCYKNPVDEKKT